MSRGISFSSSQSTIALGGILSASLVVILAGGVGEVRARKTTHVDNPVVQKVLREFSKLKKRNQWKEAAQRIKPFATVEHPRVLLEYAKMLSYGWGVPSNPDRAREHLLLIIQKEFSGRGEAAYELAKLYRKSKDPNCFEISFEWFHKAARWGFHKAHGELGRHYARGIGTPVHIRAALYHYKLAAELGSATTLIRFSHTLERRRRKIGESEVDAKQLIHDSLPLLEREAMSGKASAAKALGRLFNAGYFLPRDAAKSLYWYRRAAAMNDAGAMREAGLLILKNKPNRIQAKDGLSLLRTSAAKGDGGALTGLGRLHLQEKHGLKREKAVLFLRRAVRRGHPGAMEELGRLYWKGQLVPADESKARKLAERGSALGHKGSRDLLRKIISKKKSTHADNVQTKASGSENADQPVVNSSKENLQGAL